MDKNWIQLGLPGFSQVAVPWWLPFSFTGTPYTIGADIAIPEDGKSPTEKETGTAKRGEKEC